MTSHYRELRLILGDQLNASHSWYQHHDPNVLYVIAELHQETQYTRHHVQKICAFFAAMERFANALSQAGHQVIHFNLDQTAKFDDLPHLLRHLIDQYRIQHFSYQLPDEYRLRRQLATFCVKLGLPCNTCETEHFYLKDDELADHFNQGRHHRLENFYRRLRKRFNLLMEQEKPMGGQWNYDRENRNKLSDKDLPHLPAPLMFANDVSAILQRLKKHNVESIGEAKQHLLWPVTRQQSTELLHYFCQHMLPNFGRFQDAMQSEQRNILGSAQAVWSLYHARLSFSLNAKLLSPSTVVNTALDYFKHAKSNISLAQIEGFVRQILGWREFVRGIYWANMPDYARYNSLEASADLPSWFWSGKTKMRCMQHAIGQSLEFAYAHHIQRLMVTGNFCLIAGIEPDQVDHWYLGIYIDAIQWVELPNTRGMSQFADGGIVGSKAYAASGNYINKMSDYCKCCHYDVKGTTEDNACPLNALYWHFMARHRPKFEANPRNRMVYANWQKRTAEAQQAVLNKAERLLLSLNTL